MNLSIPAAIELLFPFRSIAKEFGRRETLAGFLQLFIDLAYECVRTGEPGILEESSIPAIRENVGSDVFQRMIEQGFLQPRGSDLFCAEFFEHNRHLDRTAIPNTDEMEPAWQTQRSYAEKDVRPLVSLLDEKLWTLPNGARMLQSEMNRIVLLILTLDRILRRRKARPAAEYTRELLEAAGEVTAKYDDALLSLVLKRFLVISRPSLNPLYPSVTEIAIARFDELVRLLMPEEGYVEFAKQQKSLPALHRISL